MDIENRKKNCCASLLSLNENASEKADDVKSVITSVILILSFRVMHSPNVEKDNASQKKDFKLNLGMSNANIINKPTIDFE